MAAALVRAGWKVTLVTDADRRSVIKTLAGWGTELAQTPGTQALFYYAGHGMQADGNNYLIPKGTAFETLNDVKVDAVNLTEVTGTIEKAGAVVSVVILDACRDNPFAKTGTRSVGGGTRGLSVVQAPAVTQGAAVLFSTSPGDVAQDGAGRNGVSTAALLKQIETDQKLESIFKKVTAEVRIDTGDKQKPWINSSLTGDFYTLSDEQRQKKQAELVGFVSSGKTATTLTVQPTVGQKGSLLFRARPVTDEAAQVIPQVTKTVKPFQAYLSLEQPENFVGGSVPLDVGTTPLAAGNWLVSAQREGDTQESWYQVVQVAPGTDTTLTVPLVEHSGPYQLEEAKAKRLGYQEQLGWANVTRTGLNIFAWPSFFLGSAEVTLGGLMWAFAPPDSEARRNALMAFAVGSPLLGLAAIGFLIPTPEEQLQRSIDQLDRRIQLLQPPRKTGDKP